VRDCAIYELKDKFQSKLHNSNHQGWFPSRIAQFLEANSEFLCDQVRKLACGLEISSKCKTSNTRENEKEKSQSNHKYLTIIQDKLL